MKPPAKKRDPATSAASEKLQKVLARAGLGSRRELEGWISSGRVSVNGKTASLGERVTLHDKLRVDGHLLNDQARAAKKVRMLMYHKPAGEVSARRDPEGRRTVFESLPGIRNGRWVMVGRLDIATCGLLLFTSDGELANYLMHPSSEIEREYAVRVLGEPDAAAMKAITEGVMLDGQLARFSSVVRGGGEGANQWYRVTLAEGRYREVRRLWESQGLVVSRLIRVRYGVLELPRELRAGQWLELDAPTIARLRGDPVPDEQAAESARQGAKRGARPARSSELRSTQKTSTARRNGSVQQRGDIAEPPSNATKGVRGRSNDTRVRPAMGADSTLPGQRRRGPPRGKSPRR